MFAFICDHAFSPNQRHKSKEGEIFISGPHGFQRRSSGFEPQIQTVVGYFLQLSHAKNKPNS
jgi:hypothetical protein